MPDTDMREAQLEGHMRHCENEVAAARELLERAETKLECARETLVDYRETP